MQKLFSTVLLLSVISGGIYLFQNQQQPQQSYAEVLKQIAREVNESNTTWKANESIVHWKDGKREDFSRLNGSYQKTKPSGVELPIYSETADVIPENFDSREQWSQCESIQEIRDQANCGSCWAFGAAEAFTDRWCIASGQKDQTRLSTQQLLTCCDTCGNGCGGGWNDIAWNFFKFEGAVSGNLYGQGQYCQSYSYAPCDHHVQGPLGPCPPVVKQPDCTYECSKQFNGTFANDRHYVSQVGMTLNNVKAMQTQIMNYGPVEGAFFVYDDFYTYKSGVYQHLTGDLSGGHSIKILGWGVENNTPYWLCANSWNTSWGDKGFFKILRGQNECGIEDATQFGYADVNRK